MKDIQSSADSRRINIRKVGVKTITYPVTVLDKANRTQSTIARVNMYVNLPHQFKGTHMSRFVEILNQFHGDFNLKTFQRILEEMKLRLDAEDAHMEMDFPYFFQADRTDHSSALRRYDCRLHGSLSSSLDVQLEVDVPLAFSGNYASCQNGLAGHWGIMTVSVRMKTFLWIEDLIGLVENAVATRCLEKETVESLCVQISEVLLASEAFQWYKVVVKNSVNGYSAFAVSQWPHQSAAH